MAIDNLGQGGKDVLLPDDIQSRLENARNNITVYEAEATRLQKLSKQETDFIHSLAVEKDSLKKTIATLKAQIDDAVNDLAAKKTDLTVLDSQTAVAQKKLDGINAESSKITSENTTRSASLDTRENSIAAVEDNLNKRHLNLLAAEGAHNARVEKLKKALD